MPANVLSLGRLPKEEEIASAVCEKEEEKALLSEREKALADQIRDLEKAYGIAMDLVKGCSKRTLAVVGAPYRQLAAQQDYPNTRDLVLAIVERAGLR